MCVTSRYFVAEPWFAWTCCGGGTRCGIGSLELGDVAGFSITVPNCEKAVGVRSSIGIRIDGHGIEVGIVPFGEDSQQSWSRTKARDGWGRWSSGACDSISGGRNRRAKIAISGLDFGHGQVHGGGPASEIGNAAVMASFWCFGSEYLMGMTKYWATSHVRPARTNGPDGPTLSADWPGRSNFGAPW